MINIGELILAARKAKGLKQFELARRAEIAAAQLCQIENGRINPSFNMVERIVEALDLTIPELLYGERYKRRAKGDALKVAGEEADSIELANYVPLRAHEPDAVKALKVVEAAAKNLDFTLAPNCTLGWNKAYIKLGGAGAMLAEELRGDLGLGTAPVGNLVTALRYRGVLVVEAKFAKAIGSVSFWSVKRNAPVVVLNSAMTAERKMYRLVYELGSAALYASLGVRLDESLEQHRFLTDFTAAFLMPGSSVRTCVAAAAVAPADWTLVKVLPLKAYFGVSAEAFILRLEELGLIVPKLRLNLREKLHAYYKKHPKAMEPQVGCRIG